MKKLAAAVVGAIAGIAMLCGSADAQTRRAPPPAGYPHIVIGPFDLGDSRLVLAGLIAGGATTGAYFAIEHERALKIRGDGRHFNSGAYGLTTIGCMALSPMLAAAIVWNTEGRYLSSQEALGLGADCIIPIVGSAIVDASYRNNPQWK
jgi:hypothetical protein